MRKTKPWLWTWTWTWTWRIAPNSHTRPSSLLSLLICSCSSLLILLLPSLLLLSSFPPPLPSFPPPCLPCYSHQKPHLQPWILRPPLLQLALLPQHEKYMWYAPHSGFSNQVGQFRNALRIAALLNRTLILPPITDHHALKLGSCPKSRVIPPQQLRRLAWSHISQLIANSRYISISDIVNITSIAPGLVRTIDFRVFALLWCGANIRAACAGPVCSHLAESVSFWGSLDQCGAWFMQTMPVKKCCIHAVDDSCVTTLWSLGENKSAGMVGRSSAKLLGTSMKHLDKKLKTGKVRKDILETLGTKSTFDEAAVLVFGSLFSDIYKGSEIYIETPLSSWNKALDAVVKATDFLPFTDAILEAGKLFSEQRIRQPYLCAQPRLLDGQFKNHWDRTFAALRAKLEKVRVEHLKPGEKLAIFVMTDLPRAAWRGTYLEELVDSNEFQVYSLNLEDELVFKVAKDTLTREYGLKSGFLPEGFGGMSKAANWNMTDLSDVLLCIEEVICACASLGFQGTSGSTITENINKLRASGICLGNKSLENFQ